MSNVLEPDVNVIPGDWIKLNRALRSTKLMGRELVSRLLGASSLTGTGPIQAGSREIVGQPFPTSIAWYTSSSKTKKVVETIVTRDNSQRPTTVVVKTYRPDGTSVDQTVTDAIVYDGSFEINRTRTIS